jgi:predicted MPP superfamily phosphohydrolase
MDNIINTGMPENQMERLKKLFKAFSSEAAFNKWADTFDIDLSDPKVVTVHYHGSEDVRLFKKECKSVLDFCVYAIEGKRKKIKIFHTVNKSSFSPKTRKNLKAIKFFIIGMIFVCIGAAVIVVLCNYIGNRSFRETFYSTSSIKADSRVRVIQLSDLHGSSYGKDNKNLLKRISELEPDVIICTGDMVDSAKDDLDFAAKLGEKLAKIAPTYYIYGNNEVDSIYGFPFVEADLDEKFGFNKDNRDETALLKIKDPFEEKLESVGVKVLKNEKDTIKVKTMQVDVYGVLNSNPSSFWSYSEKSFLNYINNDTTNLKITAVHEPFIFEAFQPDFWGDLMVCGHTHGGVVRVPVLGPLYTNEGGLLPERNGCFVYGRYDTAGKPLIVSSGLENKNVLRINNEPELVIIDINKF